LEVDCVSRVRRPLDLKWLTRDLISKMETDLGTRLEWVAAAHFNTEHRSSYCAARRGSGRSALRLSRTSLGKVSATSRRSCAPASLVSDGIRCRRCATSRGTPTSLHVARPDHPADADRPKSLSHFFTVSKDPSRAGLGPSASLIERRSAERLMVSNPSDWPSPPAEDLACPAGFRGHTPSHAAQS